MYNRAFSLLELLIVIVIVSIISILGFGVLAEVQKNGMDARCLGNMKASGMAVLNYFHDRNGAFFPTKNWFQYPSTNPEYKQGMRDYLFPGDNKAALIQDAIYKCDTMLTCPALKKMFPDLYAPGAAKEEAMHRGFAVNHYLYVKDPDSKYDSFPSAERPLLPGAPGRMAAVEQPGKMWMITEMAINGGGLGSISPNTAEHKNRYVFYPHRKQFQNMMFLDGHIQKITESEFRNPVERGAFWGNSLFNDK